MPAAKLPKIEDVLRDPSIAQSLPTPLLAQVVEQMRQLSSAVLGSVNVPPDPAALAAKIPKWKIMESRHLAFISERLAETCETGGAIFVATPPKHFKSTLCSQWLPFWALAKNPEAHILLLSYSATEAQKWGRKVKLLVETYGADYGLTLSPDKQRINDWELTTGGGMATHGVGSGLGGKQAQLFIIDDAIGSMEDANSQVLRDKLWEWWDGTALQRLEPGTPVVCIGTRYRTDDLMGQMLAQSEAGTGLAFERIILPAKALEGDALGRKPGEGLWLDNPRIGYTQDFYDKIERNVSPFAFASVYQQNPVAAGGNMVDPEWWRFYRPSELPGTFDQEVQSWDLSLDSIKKSDSYHAGLVVSRKGALLFVRDSFHEHCDINKVVSQIGMWHQLYPGAKQKLIERATAGVAVVQMLRSRIPGMLAWPPKGRQKGSKEACLDACIPDIRSGNVLLPLNADGSKPKWVQDFIMELMAFPRGAHDDWVDSFSQACNFMLPSVRSAVSRDHTDALAMKPEMTPMQAHVEMLHRRIADSSKHIYDELKQASGDGSRVIPFQGRKIGVGGRRNLW